jgi:hypothetical protein
MEEKKFNDLILQCIYGVMFPQSTVKGDRSIESKETLLSSLSELLTSINETEYMSGENKELSRSEV